MLQMSSGDSCVWSVSSKVYNEQCYHITAEDNDETLDKEATSYNDIFDAFRLALKFYHYEDSSESD